MSKDVRKEPISLKDALKLARKMKKLIGIVGQKIITYEILKDKPTDAEIEKLIIGRSGTLRAPCLQVGDIFVGGFNSEVYKELLKI